MNRLQYETSPYLLQHAHNPVDWYAWKPEALERARREDKILLVSVGYSTCHWCHVMERESFEDPAVAAYMNEHFVNVKVDREERPDLDHILMDACQAISGSGGWPLNCFLTPEGKPFYAGTYYPPRPAYNRPSWMQLLEHLQNLYRTDRATVEEQASRLTDLIQNGNRVFFRNELSKPTGPAPFQPLLPARIFYALQQLFDKTDGGFGGAPKFPGAMTLQWLLDYHYCTGDPAALEHVQFSLDKMIRGGIYDQLGGGFARYATDKAWLVPHFEKMLYDNALLVMVLADAYKLTGEQRYARTIRETLTFVRREMTHPEGGFFSALDADSEGEEGKFYVWTYNEVQEVLGPDAIHFCRHYGVTPGGNWEGHTILWQADPAWEEDAALSELMSRCRKALFDARSARVRPGLDDKILLDWNALMCSAYARAYAALGDRAYLEAAERNVRFLLEKFRQPGSTALFHTYKHDGKRELAQYDAFLDDYANLIEALFDVYNITFNPAYLDQASVYLEFVREHFLDPQDNFFYFTSRQQQDLPVRKKELFDSAVPSGNGTMVRNLVRGGIFFGRPDYSEQATDILRQMAGSIERYPNSFARLANSLLHQVFPVREIAVVGPGALDLAAELNRRFLPNVVLMASAGPDTRFPLLADKPETAHALIYICRNYSCQLPVDTVEAAMEMLAPVPE